MSMIRLRIALLGMIVATGASSLAAQTVEEILAKMIDAQGGAAAILAVRDCSMYGDVYFSQQTMTAAFSIFRKEPDKYRQELDMDGRSIVSFFNGKDGWAGNFRRPNPEKAYAAALKAMKRNALPLAAICDPAKHGLTYRFEGKEQISGRDYYVLIMTYPDGFPETQFIDSQTYLLAKKKFRSPGDAGPVVDNEIIFLSYKKAGGMLFPSVYANLYEGREYNRVSIREILVNTGLNDALFEPGNSKRPAPAATPEVPPTRIP